VRPLRIFGITVLVLFLLACAMFSYVFFGPNNFPGGGEQVFFVSRGENFALIVDTLEARGIIRNRTFFLAVAKLTGGSEKAQVGKYGVLTGISNADLFNMLVTGKGNQIIHVTIPEGMRIRGQARLFARQVGIDSAKYARLAFDPDFAVSLGVSHGSLEGYLLPDTYGFYWEQDEKEILRRQVANFDLFFSDSLREAAAGFGWDAHKTLTFASIVEGEAVLGDERPIISGVYHNRIRKGMRLEADPTIQYMFSNGPRRVLYADLKSDNPYNTYRFPGLPPGPVNNPGRASILASLYPAKHGYIFFVANGKGGHWFARTYADHLRYARMYKRQRGRG
jgi:UPF0755 protein